jgi:hypothetical protein
VVVVVVVVVAVVAEEGAGCARVNPLVEPSHTTNCTPLKSSSGEVAGLVLLENPIVGNDCGTGAGAGASCSAGAGMACSEAAGELVVVAVASIPLGLAAATEGPGGGACKCSSSALEVSIASLCESSKVPVVLPLVVKKLRGMLFCLSFCVVMVQEAD